MSSKAIILFDLKGLGGGCGLEVASGKIEEKTIPKYGCGGEILDGSLPGPIVSYKSCNIAQLLRI